MLQLVYAYMNPALDALMGAAAAVAAVPLDADRHRHAHVRAAATQLSGACADMKVKGQVGGGAEELGSCDVSV